MKMEKSQQTTQKYKRDYEQFYVNKMDNLEEMDKFLEKYNLPKLSEVKVSQSCPTVTPWTVGLPGSSVHGILQARILVWVAISSSRGSSQPKHRTQVSCIAGKSLPSEPPGKPQPGRNRISEQTNHKYRN